MNSIWYYIYNLFVIPLLLLFFKIFGLVNGKVRQGIKGRQRLFEDLIINLTGLDKSKKTIWFHSASMGEFEQAKPIIQQIKEKYNQNIIVTFFSPSGYKNSINYPYADVISYIPFDTPKKVKAFLKFVKPNLAIMMRYDIWPNFIWQLDKQKIPCLIVDATMRKDSSRKLPVSKSFHKSLFNTVSEILTVSEKDKSNFLDFHINPAKIKPVGDTRFDRVYQKSMTSKNKKLFPDNIFDNKKVLIAGSIWEADENILLPAILKTLKYDKAAVFILVPHEPTVQHIENLEHQLLNKEKTIRFSHMNNYDNERIIIIDSIGILLSLYQYADAAYVGGSFKQGIHNVLEPAVYGIPVLFGPKIENSQEALKMVELGCGLKITNRKNAYRSIRKILSENNYRNELGKISEDYVKENVGATDRIIKEINKFILQKAIYL